MDESTTEMSVPLDSDGFLRRQCPTCEKDFKWLSSAAGEGEPAPDGGYYCPYCAVQAPTDSWFTTEQIELAQNTVMREVLAPELDKMARDLRRNSRGSFLRLEVSYDKPQAMDPLVESDDMRRVDFDCHPTEPVKVLDDWNRDVHCLICGSKLPDG
ncbi:MAG: hypothetical protein ACSLFN_09405 [Candidatus Limnocylindrales bacterium]